MYSLGCIPRLSLGLLVVPKMRKKKIVAETKAQNRTILKIPKRWHAGGNVLKRARGNQTEI